MALIVAMPIRKRPPWLRELLLALQPLIPLQFQDLVISLGKIANQQTAWPDARAVFQGLRTTSLQAGPNAWVTILEVIAKEICNSRQAPASYDQDVAGCLPQLLAPFFCGCDDVHQGQLRSIERALFRRPMHVAWPAK